jgi:hypothetical protein
MMDSTEHSGCIVSPQGHLVRRIEGSSTTLPELRALEPLVTGIQPDLSESLIRVEEMLQKTVLRQSEISRHLTSVVEVLSDMDAKATARQRLMVDSCELLYQKLKQFRQECGLD